MSGDKLTEIEAAQNAKDVAAASAAHCPSPPGGPSFPEATEAEATEADALETSGKRMTLAQRAAAAKRRKV